MCGLDERHAAAALGGGIWGGGDSVWGGNSVGTKESRSTRSEEQGPEGLQTGNNQRTRLYLLMAGTKCLQGTGYAKPL